MKKIGLLVCSEKKKGKETPNQEFEAQEIYQGKTFLWAKSEGIKKYECEDWFILSGKMEYNLLEKDAKIKYYDIYLGDQCQSYKNEWANKIKEKLIKKGFDLETDQFFVFGDTLYCELLRPFLKNWVSIVFDKE